MSTVVIIGAQWGDEGKGKVVDLLSERADVVVRYAGGPNAGHTLVVGDEKIVFRLVPSGVLHPHVRCVLGQGMVISPAVLLEEIDTLAGRGLSLDGRIAISDRAHVILPHHILVDGLREGSRQGTKIGTTKRGIGPCYEDKVGRRGLRMGDLRDLDHARARVAESLEAWTPAVTTMGGAMPSLDEVMEALPAQAERLLPMIADTAPMVETSMRAGERVMLEGAQGTLLDIDHGTYPYVTSSSAVAGGACTGAGIGPSRIDRVMGITKAYTTRVGEGPFPTELADDAGRHMQNVGREFGSVTGRPRRAGWLDLVALRYAACVNGLDALAVTKLDVLTGLSELSICTGYRTAQGNVETMPATITRAEPIYETLPGWRDDLSSCKTLADLPEAARRYLRFVEERLGVPIDIVSVGPRRDETIVLRDPFA
jgi:adenylosuccinate synthase